MGGSGSVWGGVLNLVRCLVASLAFAREMPVATPFLLWLKSKMSADVAKCP